MKKYNAALILVLSCMQSANAFYFDDISSEIANFHAQMQHDIAMLNKRLNEQTRILSSQIRNSKKRAWKKIKNVAPLSFSTNQTDTQVEFIFNVEIPEDKSVNALQENDRVVIEIPLEKGSTKIMLFNQEIVVATQEASEYKKTDDKGDINVFSSGSTQAMQSQSIPLIKLDTVTVTAATKDKKLVITATKANPRTALSVKTVDSLTSSK